MTYPDFSPRFDTDIVRPYWQALERGELVLPACSECGQWQWYPFEFVKCHPRAHHEWRSVPRTGRVFTFAVVHRSFLPSAERGASPYVSALVELDGIDGVRIPTYLVNLGETRPFVGMQVRLAPQRRSNYTAPAFEPNLADASR